MNKISKFFLFDSQMKSISADTYRRLNCCCCCYLRLNERAPLKKKSFIS